MFSNAIDRMPAAFLDRGKVIRLDTPSIVYLAVAGTKPLHASSNSEGRPINFFVSAGQVNDYIRERALLSSLPDLDWLLGDWGYDTGWYSETFQDKEISVCILGWKPRKTPGKYDTRRYNRHTSIEIIFCRLRMGDVSQPDMIGVRGTFSPPSHSQQPSSIGYVS